jgi:NADH-quinone oxidoreductase subunit C
MFRRYQEKENVQKRAYYTDRFLVVPEIPKNPVADTVSQGHIDAVSRSVNVIESYMQRDNVVMVVASKDAKTALSVLKDQGYKVLTEMSAVDWLAKKGGFEVFYQLLNIKAVKRIRVKCFIQEKEAIESVEPLFRSADWAEREMYDMFGIIVNNHPNLKRILLPEDWHDYPLRKTYPLHGDEAANWYEVDLIYGKEYRDVIGPEQRDAAYVDENDTKNFARIGHEVGYGEQPTRDLTPIRYQEEGGVLLVKKMKPEETKIRADKSWNK